MKRINLLESRIQTLENYICKLDIDLWKLKNPARFSVGDEVEYKSGQTDGIFIKAKIVSIEYKDEYWQYILWVYSLNRLHEYDGDDEFFDKEHVQIRKYEQDTDTTD